uniref:Copper transport protein ATOX1 n=1 Tax=Panthera leo TaxID=9689 RepID=A0A8C9CZU3_PANLE
MQYFFFNAKSGFSVDMTCEGCSNEVSQVLNKVGEVEFDTDLFNKKVCINSEHSMDLLLETVGKTGKAVPFFDPK